MSLTSATLLCSLTEKVDQIENIGELILVLQHQFAQLFRVAEVQSSSLKPASSSFASTEEEKLLAVRAVRSLHRVGLQRHGEFFKKETYHTDAAFFIHEMLGALSGPREVWFQQLQVESLQACLAVVKAIGCRSTRLCLPGIVSACVRYIDRAHQGTDAVAVYTEAVELLRASLTTALELEEGDDDMEWLRGTVDHLGRSMLRLLNPSALTRERLTVPHVHALLHLTTDLLTLPSLGTFLETSFMREVVVGWFVLSNMEFLLRGGDVGDFAKRVPSRLFEEPAVVGALKTVLGQMSGVELLHFASGLVRCKVTCANVFLKDIHNQYLLCRALHRCIQVVGTMMSAEDLYTARIPRDYPSAVVDEFIKCAAYALVITTVEPANTGCLPEEVQTLVEAFTSECEATLMDWDLYMLHPPTIYVFTRLIIWQFITPAWGADDGKEKRNKKKGQPPEELILSGTFEQVWSIVAQPHLWNITEDENLCSYQQLQHRQTVAATILRFLELAAGVLRDEPVIYKLKRKRAVQRLNILVLYLVLEKATGPTAVHDAAMRVMEALGEAGCYTDTLSFFLDQSRYIVDEAGRAVTEEIFRTSAANVLRGGVSFVQSKLVSIPRKEIYNVATSSRQWVDDVRGTTTTATAILLDHSALVNVADFISSVVKVACDGCRRSTLQDDLDGSRASVHLLADCFAVAAGLNRSVPQLGADEENDRLTTAAEPRLQILQLTVLEAVRMLLAYCTRNNSVAPLAIRAITCGLTVFLTTPKAETWFQESEDNADGRDQPPPVFAWENNNNTAAVLPRSHLRTVYQAYLSFLAILTEPVANFATTNNVSSRLLSAREQRALEEVQPTPGVIAAMEGIETLFTLATEFLSRRIVEEVLPVVTTWYKCAALRRIPTKTDERIQSRAKKFLRDVCAIDPSLSEELRAACAVSLPSITLFSTEVTEQS